MIKKIREFLEFLILQYVINHDTTFQYMVEYIEELQTEMEIIEERNRIDTLERIKLNLEDISEMID